MKNINRNDNVQKNICAVVLYQLTALFFGILVPQLILNRYGPESHGLTSTITNLMQYILLINAGVVNVAMNALYYPLSVKDYDRVNSVLNAARKVNKKIGIVSFIIILVLSFCLSILIDIGEMTSESVILLCLAMGMQQVLDRYLICTYQILIQADQKLYIIYLINSILYVVRGSIQILLINSGASLVLVQAVPALMIILLWIVLHTYVGNKYAFLDSKRSADMASIKARKYAIPHTLAGVIANNSSAVILSIVCNQIAVSIYSVYNMVISHLHGFIITVLSRSFLTSFGRKITIESKEKVYSQYSALELIFCMVVAFAYGVCSNMLIPFVKLYTSGRSDVNYVNHTLMILIVLFGIFNGIREPAILLIDAAAYYQKTQAGAVIEMIINLSLSLIGSITFGLSGVLFGTVISFVYRYIDVTIAANKCVFEKKPFKSFRRGVQTVISVGGMFFCFHNIVEKYVHNWITWIMMSIMVSIFSGVVTLAFFCLTDYNEVCCLLKRVWNKIIRGGKALIGR